MYFNNKKIIEIVENARNQLDSKNYTKKKLDFLKDLPLNIDQCLYIVNWKEGTVPYQSRVDKILGYNKEEFDLLTILNNPHPDDKEVVLRVSKGVINHALENQHFLRDNTSHSIVYRFKKKNGEYVKILRQSTIFEFSEDGTIISNLSIITNVNQLIKSNFVLWDINTPEITLEEFKKSIYKEFTDFFTPRELEIIHCIKDKNTSAMIAEKLFLSVHTVKTHRKNLMQKCSCKTPMELLTFCQKNGIL